MGKVLPGKIFGQPPFKAYAHSIARIDDADDHQFANVAMSGMTTEEVKKRRDLVICALNEFSTRKTKS